MKHQRPSFILTSLLAVCVCVPSVRCLVSEEQHTSFGVLRGQRIQAPDNQGPSVVQFLGVPYGVVAERFDTLPRAAPKWTNKPKDARSVKPVCPQIRPNLQRDSALRQMPELRFNTINILQDHLHSQDEDCLYMNIYVPDTGTRSSQPDLHTLLIVHGDEFSWNSGNVYNGSMLASFGRIIVATIDYRLGPLGFLAHCNQDCAPNCPSQCEGNGALADMAAGLDMLTTLVTEFGGHSDSITLLGWGSGAAAVNLLMASPFAAPQDHRKFKRAVLLSGSVLSPWAMSSSPQYYFYELAQLMGCHKPPTPGATTKQSDKEIMQCIKDREINNMTSAASQIKPSTFLGAFAPIVDGVVVVNSPLRTMKEHGNLFQGVDLLVGMTSNDAYNHLSDRNIKFGITIEERERIFRTLVRNLFQYHRHEIYDALVNEYTNWASPPLHLFSLRDGVLAALNDALYVAPMVKTAQLHSDGRHARAASNTFMYLFDYESSEWPRGGDNRVQGAINGEQILYLLGYPYWDQASPGRIQVPFANQRFNRKDAEVSRLMMRLLANFVKHGDPMKPQSFDIASPYASMYTQLFSREHWPSFSDEGRQPYMKIGKEPNLEYYYRADKVAFWNEFLPKLQATGKDADTKHNNLPDHFNQNTYFGVVRPFGEFANMPFPLPPVPPPSPLPDSQVPKPSKPGQSSNAGQQTGVTIKEPSTADYSTILSVTVAVGCALLVLNILIFAGIYHQRDKQKRSKKKMQMHYHSYEGYTAGHNMSSPMAISTPMMPPAPPPPSNTNPGTPSVGAGALDGEVAMASAGSTMRTYAHHHAMHQHHAPPPPSHMQQSMQGTPRGIDANTVARQQEQEPLLSASGARLVQPSGGAPMSGVSPTCPRHGRAAMVAAAAAAAAQQHQHQQASVEEIQV